MDTDSDSKDVTFVEADGTEVTVTVGPDERLLDAARREDVDLRWGCTEGQCTSCTSRLLDGDIEWEEAPKAVDEGKRDEGYISLCITTPASDCTIEVGDDVLVEAFPRVWQNLDAAGD